MEIVAQELNFEYLQYQHLPNFQLKDSIVQIQHKKSAPLQQREILSMNSQAIADNSVFFANVDSLSLTTPELETSSREFSNGSLEWYPYYRTTNGFIEALFLFFNIGLFIFGTAGNIMILAVFRMYRRSGKSSATFLMQTLSVMDTGFLICSVPGVTMYIYTLGFGR